MQLQQYLDCGRTYMIAEMSGNHGGNFNQAMEIVYAAKQAGADCLKIQTYTADTLTLDCDNAYFTVKGGLWNGKNLYALYQEAATPWEWQKDIKDECEKLGMDFLSTPFDFTAVDFLDSIGVEAYKIASPELIDLPLIEYAAQKGKPLIISCGMGSESEIKEAVSAAKKYNVEVILLKCCSQYPSDYRNMNLSLIQDMKQRFNCPVGLSDHSMGHLGAVVAVSLGACVVEKHFCVTRAEKTADSEFSMEANEFRDMVEAIRNVEAMFGTNQYGPSEGEVRGLRNRRSLFAVKNIKKGERFSKDNIRSVRPGQGLLPKYYYDVLGKTASCDMKRGEPLRPENIEGFKIS